MSFCFLSWGTLRFRARYDPRVVPGMLQPVVDFRPVFLPSIRGVTLNRAPNQTSGMPPVIEHNALLERLASSGDRDDVVLVKISRARFGPVELEGSQLQGIQPKQEFVGVVKTVSGFSCSDVNKKALHGRRPNHPPLGRELPAGGVGGERDAPGFVRTDTGRESNDGSGQSRVALGSGVDRIAPQPTCVSSGSADGKCPDSERRRGHTGDSRGVEAKTGEHPGFND